MEYEVVSGMLSRKRGERFNDTELPGEQIVILVQDGHLRPVEETS